MGVVSVKLGQRKSRGKQDHLTENAWVGFDKRPVGALHLFYQGASLLSGSNMKK